MTRKCKFCGREGAAPEVRGAKSVGVNVGNFRQTVDVDVEICEMCANVAIGAAIGEMMVKLGVMSKLGEVAR